MKGYLNIPYIVIDKKGEIIDVNNEAGLLLKKDKNKLLNHKIYEIIQHGFGMEKEKELREAIENNRPVMKISINNINCSIKINYSNNSTKLLFNYIRDISDMYHVFENIIVGIVVADDSLTIKYSNKKIEEIFGYKCVELMGKNVTCLMPREISEEHDSYVERYKNTGESRIIYSEKRTVVGKRKNGSLVELYLSINEHWDNNGRIFIGSFEVMERKFNKNYLIFEDLIKYNSSFMANTSYELKLPVTELSNILENLKNTELNNKQLGHVNMCYELSRNLTKMIDNMMFYTKTNNGNSHVSNKSFHLGEIVEDTLSIIHSNINRKKNVNIIHYIHSNVPNYIIGDDKILRKVLYHLVNNGVKFTDTGEVDVEVEKMNDEYLKFTIKDTGIGMSNGKLLNLFRPFVRSNDGINIGLNICKLLINMNGGEIYAISRPGEGSTFVFTMKYQIDKEMEFQEKIKYKNDNLKGKKICVIDDNSTSCMALYSLLTDFGLKVQKFRSVTDGINYIKMNQIKKDPCDLVIMDFHMPIMNGLEASWKLYKDNIDVDVIILNSTEDYDLSAYPKLFRDCPLIKFTMNKPIIKKNIYSVIVKYFEGSLNNLSKTFNVMSTNKDLEVKKDFEEDKEHQKSKYSVNTNGKDSMNILVVGNNETNRNILKVILEKHNYTVDEISTGTDALKILEENQNYFAIFTDIQMPLLSGADILNIMKNHKYEIPVIAVAEELTTKVLSTIKNNEFYDYIYKLDVGKITEILKNIKNDNKSDTNMSRKSSLSNLNLGRKHSVEKKNELNIIFAEDNFVNTIIMKKHINNICAKLGIKATITTFIDGKQISEYYANPLRKDNVDLIFMDIEMPVMNGYEATKIIRKIDNDIIIVALSSTELLENPEMFTGCITRPINIGNLEKWLDKSREICVDHSEINHYIDTEIVKGLKGLGKDLLQPILKDWYVNINRKIMEIKEFMKAEKYDKVKYISHYIKGESLQIGCKKLGNHLGYIELMAHRKNVPELEESIEALDELTKTTIKYIKDVYEN